MLFAEVGIAGNGLLLEQGNSCPDTNRQEDRESYNRYESTRCDKSSHQNPQKRKHHWEGWGLNGWFSFGGKAKESGNAADGNWHPEFQECGIRSQANAATWVCVPLSRVAPKIYGLKIARRQVQSRAAPHVRGGPKFLPAKGCFF